MERGGINNEKLIREVGKRRCLWDQKSFDYLSRTLKAKEWENVSHEMTSTVDEVKNRWKLLKDSFNREVRNVSRNTISTPKWAHFEQMSFLLKGSNNLLLPSAYLSQSLIEMDGQNTASSCDNELSEENSLAAPEEDADPPASQKKRLKINHSQSNISSEISNSTPYQSNQLVEWSEPNAFRHDHGNEDYYFLMSLLPTFERMSARQKMRVKIKMMQDVYEAAFGDSASELNSSKANSVDTCLNTVSSGS